MKCEKHGTEMALVCGAAKCGMCYAEGLMTERRVTPPDYDPRAGFGLSKSARSGKASKNKGLTPA